MKRFEIDGVKVFSIQEDRSFDMKNGYSESEGVHYRQDKNHKPKYDVWYNYEKLGTRSTKEAADNLLKNAKESKGTKKSESTDNKKLERFDIEICTNRYAGEGTKTVKWVTESGATSSEAADKVKNRLKDDEFLGKIKKEFVEHPM